MKKFLCALLVIACANLLAQENNITFYYNNKIYCLNKDGNEVYPPFNVTGRVTGYNYSVTKDNKKVYVYKLQGIEKLIGNEKDTVLEINTYGKLLAIVKTVNGYFLKDEFAGNLPVSGYDSLAFLNPSGDSLPAILVKKNQLFGVVDLTGKMILPCEFSKINVMPPNMLTVEKDSLIGIFTDKGKELTKIVYQDLGYLFDEGKLAVKRNGLWGFIDKAGKEIIKPFLVKKPQWFNNGFSEITMNDEYSYDDKNGLMDSNGKIILPMEFGSIYLSACGIVAKKNINRVFSHLPGKHYCRVYMMM